MLEVDCHCSCYTLHFQLIIMQLEKGVLLGKAFHYLISAMLTGVRVHELLLRPK